MRSVLVLVCSFFLAWTSSAKMASIQDGRCVSASPKRTHSSVTDYETYSKQTGAKFTWSVKEYKTNIPLVEMTKSKPHYFMQTETETDALVLVEMRPTNLTNGIYYPRFLIRCKSKYATNRFHHSCQLQKPKSDVIVVNGISYPSQYAILNFKSSLNVRIDLEKCPKEAPTRLEYALTLETDPKAVDEIKTQVIHSVPISDSLISILPEDIREKAIHSLKKLLEALYNEDEFYPNYYKNFYNSWVNSLEKN